MVENFGIFFENEIEFSWTDRIRADLMNLKESFFMTFYVVVSYSAQFLDGSFQERKMKSVRCSFTTLRENNLSEQKVLPKSFQTNCI